MSKIPSPTVLAHAAKLAITEDRPIYLDYYNDSIEKKCCIGAVSYTHLTLPTILRV